MTKIVLADSSGLKEALAVLRKGGTVIYPTETSYGIGCDFTDESAVEKVHEIKNRPQDKKFIVIVDSLRTIGTYAQITDETRRLVHAFMPGAFTLVVSTYYKDTIAFRISSHPFAQEMCRQLKKPVVSTSANIASNFPIFSIDEIRRMFDGKVDLIVDGGTLPQRLPTTIYSVVENKVLRKGSITEEEILGALKQ